MTTDTRLSAFFDIARATMGLQSWHFDGQFRLLDSSCEDPDLLTSAITLFSESSIKGAMASYSAIPSAPHVFTTAYGLEWSAAYIFSKTEDICTDVYVLGPYFSTEIFPEQIDSMLASLPLPEALRQSCETQLRACPVISTILSVQYAIQLYYCLTGEVISGSDLILHQITETPPRSSLSENHAPGNAPSLPQRQGSYLSMLETQLLTAVEEGSLNYKELLQRGANAGPLSDIPEIGSLRRLKDQEIIFIALCTRAAIRGGLSKVLAFALGNRYISDMEQAATFSEVTAISHEMYGDFVRRVRKEKTMAPMSPPIRQCCDYIDTHPEEALDVKDLAQAAGYTDYYFTRLFRRETGCGIAAYIRNARLRQAELYLTNTSLTVQEISERLHFCSDSYFAKQFRAYKGCSPAEFRRKKQR